jgi:hypothetical protein
LLSSNTAMSLAGVKEILQAGNGSTTELATCLHAA